MSVWIILGSLALGTMAMKAVGPVLAGGRRPAAQFQRVIELFAPALLTALVITGTFGAGARVVLDARAVGVLTGVVALRTRRFPLLGALLVAAAATACTRALLGT